MVSCRLLCRFTRLKHIVKVAVAVASLCQPAGAQIIRHGTYFVAGFFTDYGVVSIDSRERGKAGINDQSCKIVLLSKDSFFFVQGVGSGSDMSGNVVFDVRDIARSIYGQFGVGTPNYSLLAQTWASRMAAIYNSSPGSFAPSVVQGHIGDGFFVGIDTDGGVSFAGESVTYEPFRFPPFDIAPEPNPVNGPFGAPTYVSGYPEIIREFKTGEETERAKQALSAVDVSLPIPDIIAARYSIYAASVRDWAGNNGIGGDIATIIIERGKGWRWFHRPTFCPEK